MKELIIKKPFVFRFEMVEFIAEEFDIDVSLNTISRFLQKEQISRKKVHLKDFYRRWNNLNEIYLPFK